MAAYASLLSLGHILDQLSQHPPRQRDVLDKAQIDSLLDNITFLQDFLEEFSLIRGDEILALEEKISRSAYAAKDIIESRVVDQILDDSEAGGSESSSTLFCQDLHKVIEEFDSMKKDVMKIKETEGIKIMEQPRKAATAGSFIRGASNSKNTMVGFDEDLIQIMYTLTERQSNLRIISIVGMGGIGKTTLATNVYRHSLIVCGFDIHAWATISQQYSVHEIILALLKDVLAECRKEEGGEEITQLTDEELGELLYKSLSGGKYLIVMDDMWSIECWNAIKRFFPDNNNGSRVMITTRLTNVANDFPSCTPHQLHFLNEDQSWALFCDKVFGKESCPPELEEVGRTIVRNCGALPLAIVAISGLLAKSSRTVDHWEYVANDTNAALNMGGDGLCIEILSLSYKHLPLHLKPCFLYMAMFPEGQNIRISRLIKLWVAEGILKPIRSKSLEEIAEDNLKDLIDRNLIMIHDYGSRNKIKTCTIHNLIRDLCLKEAQKVKFPRVAVMDYLNYHITIIGHQHQLIIQRSSNKEDRQQQIFDTSSLACSELKSTSAKLHKLLRVLNMDGICTHEEIVQLVNSSYIDFNALYFPNLLNTLESLSLLWNLQTVTISDTSSERPINLPAEIWEMPQLRHLKGEFYLSDPPSTDSKNGGRAIFVLKNLQTLYKIRNFRCTDQVVGRIPNLRKLGITYREFPSGFGWDYYEFYNLSHLHNLESLFLDSDENVLSKNLCFPSYLKKLTLRKCGVSWEDLTVVGSLPNLEVLNLMFGAVRGREWNPVEGQFCRLKSLRIVDTDLVEWIADSYHFPCLEKLQLMFLRHLKEIPYGIGEIPTLGSISLLFCSYSAHSSAKKIQEEQQIFGNDDLQLQHLHNARNHRLIFCNEKSVTTAYASLLSLGHILDQLLQHSPCQMAGLDKDKIDSLLEKLTFLRDFIEEFSLVRGDEIQVLVEKIARSAYAAEDIIERHVVDQIFENSEAKRRSGILSCLDLLKVIEEFDSMKKDVTKIKETERIKIMEQPRIDATAGSFVRGASTSKNTMLGFDDHLNQIIETLTGDKSNLQIISIVGMGGIGKTTLARNVFHDPSIVCHFDRHVWVTISQQYSVQEILLGLLKDFEVLEGEGEGEEITEKNVGKLGLLLYKNLFDRRYFIVMDDMWSIEVWDAIRRFFPDNNNGSRVMVTTRLSHVADNFHSCPPHQLDFLDKDQSWALFCDKVFGQESCPRELVEIGKKIVRNCRGLPLAVVAISGLAKSNQTVEYWEDVANNTYEELDVEGDVNCFGILSLSYEHLPVHLKPCFLCMAIFPEDHEIRISKLIKLWVSEGILKPKRSSSLEEVAEDNLKDLIDRNLIRVHDYGSRNKIKTCTIHDLLRDLCLRECQKEKFPRVSMMDNLKYPSGIFENQRQLIIQRSSDNEECQQQVFDTSSFACSELKSTSAMLHRLLRVLNMDDICSYEEIVRFVNSRYIDLDAETFSNLLNTLEPLSVLCNLQTIIISDDSLSGLPLNLPDKIWEMPQLRHLKMENGNFYLPDPPSTNNKNGRQDVLVLKNLQTLYKIRNFRCTDEVVGRIPNLRKLGITYREFPSGFGWGYYEVYNLAHLHNLESLFLESYENVLSKNISFPSSLKKLTLRKCGVSWEDLTVVGALSHLEVLNLSDHAVKGREWYPVEGQFLKLKSLLIEITDLVEWIADSSHFQCLETLELRGLKQLTKIPYGIGGIDTLRSISLEFCSDSANSSAKKIQEEQQNLGNPMFLSISATRKYT